MTTAEERIADAFNRCFASFNINIKPGDVAIGVHRTIPERGWLITYRVLAGHGGLPSLKFYATHRMANDRHARIWADCHLEHLDAIQEFYGYDPKVPGSKEAAEEQYLRHNRAVAEQLRSRGPFPEGDINAFLRTGGADAINADESVDSSDGGDLPNDL